jgi:hypothetical protein
MALRRRGRLIAKDSGGFNLDAEEKVEDPVLDDEEDEDAGNEDPGTPASYEFETHGLPPGKKFLKVGIYAVVFLDRRNLQLFIRKKTKKYASKYVSIGFYGELDRALKKILLTEYKTAITKQERASIEEFLQLLTKTTEDLVKEFRKFNAADVYEILTKTGQVPKRGREAEEKDE